MDAGLFLVKKDGGWFEKGRFFRGNLDRRSETMLSFLTD